MRQCYRHSGLTDLKSQMEPLCYRSAGACPPRALNTAKTVRIRGYGRFPRRTRHGEGQALALRWKAGCFRGRSAGACPPRALRQNEKRPQPKKPWTLFETINAWHPRIQKQSPSHEAHNESSSSPLPLIIKNPAAENTQYL